MTKKNTKKEESSHRSTSSTKYDAKRIDSDTSDDDTVYKPRSRKRKKSDSDDEQEYQTNKLKEKKSYNKGSAKKRHYDSSEESEMKSDSDREDENNSSRQVSDSEEDLSNRSNADEGSNNEHDSDNRSSSEEDEDHEENHSEKDDDFEEHSDSPEKEIYVPVKIKKERESPPRHYKSSSIEKSKSSHIKSSHTSSHSKGDYKSNNITIKKEEAYENVKIKKEKIEKDDTNSKRQKEDRPKSSSDKKHYKSSSSYSESKSSKQSSKPDKKVKVKIEKEEDGSIDCESGASFADALLGLSDTKKKTAKKKSTSSPQDKSSKPSSKPVDTKSKSSSKSDPRSSTSSSSKSSFREPDLLSKHVKLEPLDVDLKSTLPEITPNYKPLPHYSPPSSPLNKRTKLLTEEEALNTMMSNKNQRTKVYSGNKTGYTKVPSLFDLCTQVLRDNIEALEFTGGVPYDLLKPVLDRATASQLFQLEHYNPYLVEDTDGLWQFHCNKDFRGKKPDEFETWRELYMRLFEERERKLEALKANITQSMAKNTPIRQTKLAYVDSVVKPPRNIAKKQMKYGTAKAVKHDLVSKAMVGAASSTPAPPVVPVPSPAPSRASQSSSSFPIPNFLKKKKAPLMAKTLQLIKGNRFKR